MLIIEINELLRKHNLPPDSLETTDIQAEDLRAVFDDHQSHTSDLERVGEFVTGQLRRVSQVHSLRYRVKDPEHLVAKIIRKRIDQPGRVINIENYTDEITDLIGVRVLHLLKEDWASIHDYISSTWPFKEDPTANIRKGDSEVWSRAFEEKGCKINVHKSGYRSVHYLIQSQPTKNVYTAEVQVRTIFEEGWSEIDHEIRYPKDQDNPLLSPLLFIFNRLAGNADEIASYIQELKTSMDSKEETYRQVLQDRDQKVADLQLKIEKLEIDADAKRELKEELDTINNYEPTSATQPSPGKIKDGLTPLTDYTSYFEPLAKHLRRESLADMMVRMGSAALSNDATTKYLLGDPLADAVAKHLDMFNNPLAKYKGLYTDPKVVGHAHSGTLAKTVAKMPTSSGRIQGVVAQPAKITFEPSKGGAIPDAKSERESLRELDASDSNNDDAVETVQAIQASSHSVEALGSVPISATPYVDDGNK